MASDLDRLHAAHAALGAVFGERRGWPVVLSYGEAAEEYRAAREEAGLHDLSDRAVLEASGPKRQAFLQGMLSNDIMCQPGQGCRAALLTAKGAVQALVRVLVEEDLVVLETDADRLEVLRSTLERHRVAAPVRFASPPAAVLALVGPRAVDAVTRLGVAPPDAPESHGRVVIAGQGTRIARAGDLPQGGFVLHVSADGAAPVFEALRGSGARPIGREAIDVLRVETSRPWWGSDVGEANLLHETALLAECHSPTKGCYLGQEVVARLQARGANVSRALRRLRLTAPAGAGDTITADGREVGRVTTAAVSPRLGPIALGYLHRSHYAPGTAVLVAGAPGTVVASFEEPA